MNFLERGMQRITILLVFILLAACTSEEPAGIAPSRTPFKATPALAAEITAGNAPVTPLPTVNEECVRGDYFDQIESGGQARQYVLHVPVTYDPAVPAALVLVFHGAGISAERFVSYTKFSNVAVGKVF